MARGKRPSLGQSQSVKKKIESIKDSSEKEFFRSITSAEAYVRLERDLADLISGGEGDLSNEGFHSLLEPFCRACWSEFERSSRQNGNPVLAQAQAEAQRLRKQLDECNLIAMKQVSAMRTGHHCTDGELGEDAVQFYEPLHHLDTDTKELVLRICADKVRQIESGTAPNALMASILEALGKGPSSKKRRTNGDDPDGDSDERTEELLDQIEELKQRMQTIEQRAKHAQDMEEVARQQARDADRRFNEAKSECTQLQEEARSLHEEISKRCAELDQAKEMVGTAQAKLSEAESRLEATAKVEAELRAAVNEERAKVAGFEEELKNEREASASLREELAKSKQALDRVKQLEVELKEARAAAQEARQQAEELEASQRELKAKAMKLEQEAVELRTEIEEFKRKSSTNRTCGTQSTLTGEKVESMQAENERLKVALEELRAKLGELMAECKKKGINAQTMHEIAENCGLSSLMKAKSVFEKLYEDAMQRVERLEKLREKYRNERAGMTRKSQDSLQTQESSPKSSANPLPERRILEEVRQSNITEEWPGKPEIGTGYVQDGLTSLSGGVHVSPFRSALGISGSDPPVGPHIVERGASMVQRAQALRAQANSTVVEAHYAEALAQSPPREEQTLHRSGHRSGVLPPSVLAKAPTKGGVAGGTWDSCAAASSSTPKGVGRTVSFVPSPRDTGVEAGNELARRLAASSSLPSLGHPRVVGLPRETGGGYAQSGLKSLMGGGRDTGWR